MGRKQGRTGEVSGPTCEWCRLAQGAVVRGGERPGQAGAKGCGRSRGELFAQQPPLRVVSRELPKPPLQRLPKQPQLLVGLGQLFLGLRWEKPGRAGGGIRHAPPPGWLSPTWSSSPEGQAPRGVEPPRREASLLHSVNNQLSQDGKLRTDSRSVTSTYMCGPRRLPEDRRDLTGPGTVQGS